MEVKKYRKPQVRRKKTKIQRDTSRVITRTHFPEERFRIPKIIDRVLNLTENEAAELMEKINLDFFDRHKDIKRVLEHHFDEVSEYLSHTEPLSEIKKMLIGAYFTLEYSVESAALFNPSIVQHPDQTNVPDGSLRFIMSLRSVGEGHISSISFRSGIIENNSSLIFDPVSEFVETPVIQHDPIYNRRLIQLKLNELNACNETTTRVLEQLPDEFTYNNLNKSIGALLSNNDFEYNDEAIEMIYWLADSNYAIKFHTDHRISERVIFPVSKNESRGIEDARFVQFFHDNSDHTRWFNAESDSLHSSNDTSKPGNYRSW